jgi:hypothetical protein
VRFADKVGDILGAMSAPRCLLLATLGLVGAGCGGDDVDCKAALATKPPTATAPLVSLPGDQRGLLCDQTACQNGGYGVQHACPNGPSVTFAGSRGQCLSQFPSNPDCHATVKDLMDCMEAIHASPCVETFLGGSACKGVTQFECLTFKPNAAQSRSMAAVTWSSTR